MSNSTTPPLALRILNVGLYVTMATGACMVLLPQLTLQGFGLMIFQDSAAMTHWPEEARQYTTLAHAVMGSVMIGWAVLMRWVSRDLNSERGRHARSALLWSMVLWYLPDTSASLVHGFWQNALFNTSFLILLGVPLLQLGKPADTPPAQPGAGENS